MEEEPKQTVNGSADADTLGKGFTVIEYPLEIVPKPHELLPFTVNVPLVALGAKSTVITFPLPFMVTPVPL